MPSPSPSPSPRPMDPHKPDADPESAYALGYQDGHRAGERAARINGDGRAYGMLQPGESIEIARGPEVIRLIRLVPEHFAAAVKRKFHLHDA